jgi:Calcium-binding EGF domain
MILSMQLPVVVERVNRVLDGVVDVEVEWEGGDLHGRVGEHVVHCRVTRLAAMVPGATAGDAAAKATSVDDQGRTVATQCFHVPFSILDTNECLLPQGHVMRHRCSESSICVNTVGSYECVCPRVDGKDNPSVDGPSIGGGDDDAADAFWTQLAHEDRSKWEISFNTTSLSSCPSRPSTHNCCPDRAHTSDGMACRSRFQCPIDPCASDASATAASRRHNCARKATCVRTLDPLDVPANFRCQCPNGLMGNGKQCGPDDPKPQPKVMYDGITPTEETIKNDYYCDCTRPVVDACSGFPPCKGTISNET